MRIAIPHWGKRVSPVFDVADNVLLVEVTNGCEQLRRDVSLQCETLVSRIDALAELGADVLVCGAISRALEMGLTARGIRVVSQTCGNIEQVLGAYISGEFNPNAFLMPGCRRRRSWGGGGGNRCGNRPWRNRQKGGGNNARR